jgi:hypothetical protein
MFDSGLEMLDGSFTACLSTPVPTSSNNLVSTLHSVISQKTVFLYFNILETPFFTAECCSSECCIVV